MIEWIENGELKNDLPPPSRWSSFLGAIAGILLGPLIVNLMLEWERK
jgi:hypothetical protein